MRKKSTAPIIVSLIITALIALSVAPAMAQTFTSVSTGGTKTHEFYLNDVFDYSDFSPSHYFVVSTIPDLDSNPAGDLTITLSAKPEMDFTSRMIYSMTGGGISLDSGFDYIFAAGAAPGTSSSTTISVNSVFGIYFLAVKIDMISGTVETPVPFTISFTVSEIEDTEG